MKINIIAFNLLLLVLLFFVKILFDYSFMKMMYAYAFWIQIHWLLGKVSSL